MNLPSLIPNNPVTPLQQGGIVHATYINGVHLKVDVLLSALCIGILLNSHGYEGYEVVARIKIDLRYFFALIPEPL